MDFRIKCRSFIRLINLTKNLPDEDVLKCLRLEYQTGKCFAIVTNQTVAAVEYLGKVEQTDGVVHIMNNPEVLAYCKEGMIYDSDLDVTSVPEICVGTLSATHLPPFTKECILFPDSTPMDNWRSWFPEKNAEKQEGFMQWTVDDIASLAATCPSGFVRFPEVINTNEPVIIRDNMDENWCGVFIPQLSTSEPSSTFPARLPTWL